MNGDNKRSEEYHELKLSLAILTETTKKNTENLVYLQGLVQKYLCENSTRLSEYGVKIDNIEKWRETFPNTLLKQVSVIFGLIQLVVMSVFAILGFSVRLP